VLIRVLLHDLGRQLPEKGSLTIARSPTCQLLIEQRIWDILESIKNSLSSGFLFIRSSPLFGLVGILNQDIERILHLLDSSQFLDSSFVGRLESFVLRSISDLVLGG